MSQKTSLALLCLVLCGCGSSPTAPAPTPVATLQPVAAPLEMGTFQPTVGWPYSAELENVGSGCASNIRGTMTFRNDQGATVATSDWTWAGVVRPGARQRYTGCCVAEDVGRAIVHYSVVLRWVTVAC